MVETLILSIVTLAGTGLQSVLNIIWYEERGTATQILLYLALENMNSSQVEITEMQASVRDRAQPKSQIGRLWIA